MESQNAEAYAEEFTPAQALAYGLEDALMRFGKAIFEVPR